MTTLHPQLPRLRYVPANAEESKLFWGGIWDEVKDHNKQAEWLKEIKENVTYSSQDDLQITKEKVEMHRKMPN